MTNIIEFIKKRDKHFYLFVLGFGQYIPYFDKIIKFIAIKFKLKIIKLVLFQ